MKRQIVVIEADVAARSRLRLRLESAGFGVTAHDRPLAGLADAEILVISNHSGLDVSAACESAPPSPGGILALLRRARALAGQRPAIVAVAPAPMHGGCLDAGADEVLLPDSDERLMRARLRALLRDLPDGRGGRSRPAEFAGMAEERMPWAEPALRVAVLSSDRALAQAWRRRLETQGGFTVRCATADNIPPEMDAVLLDPGSGGRSSGVQQLAEVLAALPADGSCRTVTLLQRRPDRAEEALALDIGAQDVWSAALCRPGHEAEFSARVGRLMETVRGRAGRAQRLRLSQEAARRDPLTGLLNRAQILPAAVEAVGRCGRVGILMVDIDRFKAVNDRHGHAAGDAALLHLAGILGSAEPAASCYRYGGEEFLLLLPGADETAAASIAERLRHAIAASALSIEGVGGPARIRLSASFGVAICERASDHDACPEQAVRAAMNAADAALLRAKALGRNTVLLDRRGLAA